MTSIRMQAQGGGGAAGQSPSDQIRADVEAALRDAMTAREAAEALAQDVPAPPPPPQPGETFTIEEGGRVVQVGPEGVRVLTETTQPGVEIEPQIPREAVAISIAFFVMIAVIIVGLPIARAFARRMDRTAAAPRPQGDPQRLVRIEQAVEAVAVEVERISENQRYVTRLLSEGSAPARPLRVPAGDESAARAAAPDGGDAR